MSDVTLSKDAEKILEMVESLSVLDMANLVKAMEEKFGVSAAAPVMMAGATPAEGASDDSEQSSMVDVVLLAAGDQKINAIKTVREITGLGLAEAKGLVDGAPKAVKEGIPRAEVEEIKGKLEAAGATVELK